jgi:hypothetical protein
MGLVTPGHAAVTLNLSSASGGFSVAGSRPNFKSGYGSVNGLGVGTPSAGVSILSAGVADGVLYTTTYNIVISGMTGTHRAEVTVYVSGAFSHPALLYLLSCYPSSACSAPGSYTTISSISSAPTTVIASPGVQNGTYTAALALFVSNTNGAGAFAGADSATLTFKATDLNNSNTSTATLALNTPSETIQTAVQLLLATAGGLTISAGGGNPDFSTNFGNVNGLGLGPGAGLSVLSASGGFTYSTPYLIQPSFSSFSSITCSVSAYVSTNFAHPSTLALEDSGSAGGPYVAISISAGSPTIITHSGASGSSITRYLGLFVSSANGAGAFPGVSGGNGSDSATLTYTLTVP